VLFGILSSKVYEDVRGKIELSYDDLGEQQLKNIAQSVRCYRVSGIKRTTSLLGDAKTLARPDKPSIAVLPFTNLSGDPDQEYFGDGIAEDILTDLAKLRWLFVIACNFVAMKIEHICATSSARCGRRAASGGRATDLL
jgi:adenylate cyclase